MLGKDRLSRALKLILLVAVLVSQLAGFAPGHSRDHAKHCCPVCHASHAPLLGAAPLLKFAPPDVRIYWRIAPVVLPSDTTPSTCGASTRGPPSLSSAA